MEFSAEFTREIEEFVKRATAAEEETIGKAWDETPHRVPLAQRWNSPSDELLQATPTPRDFVLPGLEVGDTGLLAGAGGSGKSWLVLEIAVGLALGWSWPWPRPKDPRVGVKDLAWVPPGPQRVAYFSAEEREHHLARRLHAIGQRHREDLGRRELDLLRHNLLTAHTPQDHLTEVIYGAARPGDFAAQVVDELGDEGLRLIVLDPIASFAPSAELDAAGAAALVEVVRGVAAGTGAAVLLVHHSSQAAILSREVGQTAARGHTALVDGQRWVATLSAALDPDEAAARGLDEVERRRWVRLSLPKTSHSAPLPDITFRRSLDEPTSGVLEPAPLPEALDASSASRGASSASRGGGNGKGKKSSGLEPYGVHA